MALAQTLHYGASLLELSEGGGMKPQVFGTGNDLAAQYAEGFPFAFPHFAYLLIPSAGNSHTKKVYVNN